MHRKNYKYKILKITFNFLKSNIFDKSDRRKKYTSIIINEKQFQFV